MLALAALALVAAPASAQEQTTSQAIDQQLGDHTKYQAAIASLQRSVAAHDAATVAGLVSYPIRVTLKGKPTTVASAKDFIARYDQIMTPDIAAAVTGQRYDDLFVNYKGVMFGNGQVWLNGICRDKACKTFDVKAIAIQHGPS